MPNNSQPFEENSFRLCEELQKHRRSLRVRCPHTKRSTFLATRARLVHSTPSATFAAIAANELGAGRCLLSPNKLAEALGKTPRADSAEARLNTGGFVFLYCGQFRYPNTRFGFVFSPTIENPPAAGARVAPFDTGSLANIVLWPTHPGEGATGFLDRHYLPVPQYRHYLAGRLACLFSAPDDYFHPSGNPVHPDPIGLTPHPGQSPDARVWTFEVQIPDKVDLASPHLQAVICSDSADENEAIEKFLSEITKQKVAIVPEEALDEGDFSTLQHRLLDFLEKTAQVAVSV